MFWLIVGLLLGAGLFWLATNVKLSWYEWVLVLLGIVLMLFGIQNYSASLNELESRAGNFMVLLFMLPGFILVVIGLGLAWMRARKQAIA